MSRRVISEIRLVLVGGGMIYGFRLDVSITVLPLKMTRPMGKKISTAIEARSNETWETRFIVEAGLVPGTVDSDLRLTLG